MYDIIIIGAGAAGTAAAVTAAKKNLKTLVLTKEVLQLQTNDDPVGLFDTQNLEAEFQNQIKQHPNLLELNKGTEVINLEKNIVSFSVEVKTGNVHYGRSIIIATGHQSAAGFDLITQKDISGKIKVDSQMRTNIAGVFAAGQITSAGVNSSLISAGQGAFAALSAKAFLGSTPLEVRRDM